MAQPLPALYPVFAVLTSPLARLALFDPPLAALVGLALVAPLPAALLGLAAFAPQAHARSLASEQFALSPQTQASACFINCHNMFCDMYPMPDNRINFPAAVTINCAYDLTAQLWRDVLGRCLAVTCASAPDVAYAVEYGRHFCARAGVPGVEFEMPQRFLLSQGGAYYNETIAAAAGRHAPAIGLILAAGTLSLLA